MVPAVTGGTPGTGGGGATGLWNMRVNSPGSDDDGAAGRDGGRGRGGGVPAATGGIPGTGGGGTTGLWNRRVNSPGPVVDGATGLVGGMGGMDCVVPAEPGGIPGNGVGSAVGLWNIRMNSSGSEVDGARRVGGRDVDCVVPAATGGTPGTGTGAAAGAPASGRFQKPALPNSCDNPATRSCSANHSSSRWYGGAIVTTNVLPCCSPTSISFAIDCGCMARSRTRRVSFSGVFPPTSRCTATWRPVLICTPR